MSYYLFADLKKMLQGKRFASNEEMITETEAYFESKNQSFYKKGIKMLEKRWKVEFCLKSVVFLDILRTYWVMCYYLKISE